MLAIVGKSLHQVEKKSLPMLHAAALQRRGSGICVAGVVLYRASPHPPRHFVVDVFLVLLVFLSVGLLYLRWEMFSKSMFFGCLPGFVVGVCFVSVTKT